MTGGPRSSKSDRVATAVVGTCLATIPTWIAESILLQPISLPSGKTIYPHPTPAGWVALGGVLLLI